MGVPSRSVGLHDQPVQPCFVHLEVTVVTGFAFVVVEHRRGATDERTVGKDLDRTEPEPRVSEPAVQPQVEHKRLVVIDMVFGAVQRLDRRHERHPNAQSAVATSLLVCSQFERLVGAQNAADAGFLATGDALGQIPVRGCAQILDHVGYRPRVKKPARERLGLFFEKPVRLAVWSNGDNTAFGHRCLADPRQAHRRGVDNTEVP